jgi:hypothetical protein
MVTPTAGWLRWFVTDSTTGRVVIAQWPNASLWTWLVAMGGHAVTGAGWLSWVATAALVVWGALEVCSGASPLRRVLGAAVLAVMVAHTLR